MKNIKQMRMTNLKMLVTNLEGSRLRRSLRKMTTMPPLLRSTGFYLI